MYTQYAENLLKTVSEKVNNLKHDIAIAKNTITSFTQQMDSDGMIIFCYLFLFLYIFS